LIFFSLSAIPISLVRESQSGFTQRKSGAKGIEYIKIYGISIFYMKKAQNEIEVGQEERNVKDCLSCKVIGVGMLSGVSGYGAHLFYKAPKANTTNRVFFACFSVMAAAAAVARALN
jgi:hypothetical protein